MTGHRDQRDRHPFYNRQDRQNLWGFTRIRYGDDQVARGDHAKVTMTCLTRVDKKRWCAGALECGRDHAYHVTGISHANPHHAARTCQQELTGVLECAVQASCQLLKRTALQHQDVSPFSHEFDFVHYA